MPVTFAPAQPMSTPIAEGYGATEQFDRTLPVIAGLYEAGARNRLQSQQANLAADIHNQTVGAELSSREANVRDTLASRDRLEQQQMQQQRQMQDKQIEAQQQAQYMNWAMHDSAVTQQEVLHQQRQQQGLAQLVQMTQDGSLDMSDPNVRQMVTDVTGELKTGINFTQRRQQQQQGADMEAQAKLRDQQAARITKSEEDATKYESDLIKAGYNTIVQRDGNGYPHVLIKNKKTGEWYNPMKDTLSMTGKNSAGPGQFEDKSGGFDAVAAHKDALARAEANPDFVSVDEKGKATLNADGRKWVKDRMDGLERLSKYPGGTEQERQQAENEAQAKEAAVSNARSGNYSKPGAMEYTAQAIAQSTKITPLAKQGAQQFMQTMQQIQQQYPDPTQAPEEVFHQYRGARGIIQALLKEAGG